MYPTQSFTPMHSSQYQYNIVSVSCCPTMDIIALRSSSVVTLFRLMNWEKLFTVNCSSDDQMKQNAIKSNANPYQMNISGSSMAWRPDGREFAVGIEDGSIIIFGVEDGEETVKRSYPALNSDSNISNNRDTSNSNATPANYAIKAINWVCFSSFVVDDGRFYEDRTPDLLPISAPLSASSSNGSNSDSAIPNFSVLKQIYIDSISRYAEKSLGSIFTPIIPNLSMHQSSISAGNNARNQDTMGYNFGRIMNTPQPTKSSSSVHHSKRRINNLIGIGMDILISGDSNGHIFLHSYGVHLISQLNLYHILGIDEESKLILVNKLNLSQDFSVLQAVVSVIGISTKKLASGGEEMPVEVDFRYIILDTSIIRKRVPEISQISLQNMSINDLVTKIHDAFQNLEKIWMDNVIKAIRVLFKDLVTEMKREINKNNIIYLQENDDGSILRILSVISQLSLLLTFGAASIVLITFVESINDQQFVKSIKQIESAMGAMDILISQYVFSPVQEILFRLGDLHGQSKSKEYFADLGATPELIDGLSTQASKIMYISQELSMNLIEARADFSSLMSWLRRLGKKINNNGDVSVLSNIPIPDVGRIMQLFENAKTFESNFDKISRQLNTSEFILSPFESWVDGADEMEAKKNQALPSWDRDNEGNNDADEDNVKESDAMNSYKTDHLYFYDDRYDKEPTIRDHFNHLRNQWTSWKQVTCRHLGGQFNLIGDISLFHGNLHQAEMKNIERLFSLHDRFERESNTSLGYLAFSYSNNIWVLESNVPCNKSSNNIEWALSSAGNKSSLPLSATSGKLKGKYITDVCFYCTPVPSTAAQQDDTAKITSTMRNERIILALQSDESRYLVGVNLDQFQFTPVIGIQSMQGTLMDNHVDMIDNCSSIRELFWKERALLPSKWKTRAVAVSGSRGIGFVLSANKQIDIFDLEHDDEDEEAGGDVDNETDEQ